MPHGGNATGAMEGILDFSSNLNPYGPPRAVMKAVAGSVGLVSVHPGRSDEPLKAALAEEIGCDTDCLIVGAGAMGILQLLTLAFVDRGTRVLIPAHTFGEYERLSLLAGGRIVKVSMSRLRLHLEELVEGLRRGDIIFLCNPNNPTGQYVGGRDLRRLVAGAEETDALLVVDEAFIDFIARARDLRPLAAEGSNLILVRSFTKTYSIPGIRIGYAVGSPENIAALARVQLPWSVGPMAVAAAIAALRSRGFLLRSRRRIAESKSWISKALPLVPSSTNFFLLRAPPAPATVAALIQGGLKVRDCSSFGLPDHIRFCVLKDPENHRLADALNSILT